MLEYLYVYVHVCIILYMYVRINVFMCIDACIVSYCTINFALMYARTVCKNARI